jgi:hypothetical protein
MEHLLQKSKQILIGATLNTEALIVQDPVIRPVVVFDAVLGDVLSS